MSRLNFSNLHVTPVRLASIIKLVDQGIISRKEGSRLVVYVQAEDRDPEDILKERNMGQISDPLILEETVKKVIAENPKEVERYKNGEIKLIGFFVGQALKLTGGKGNPKEINAIVIRHLT